MSKRAFKSQASSSRAFSGGFDTFGGAISATGFGRTPQSQLSHVYEPPTLTGLSDAQVVVAFKNVQKKDSTTKSKALEDLQGFVQTQQQGKVEIENEFLDAWIKVYPRTSIDNSRRVRLLAHTLQGQIASACGKRIAKHLPQIVGSWLLGIYDVDKSISRATQDSFKMVFPTEEKYNTVWKAYQEGIVMFIRNVVEKETPQTLSDERITSSDDSNTKYDRTLGAALQMANFMIDNFTRVNMSKSATELEGLLKSDKLWKLASSSDPFVRRSVYKFLVTCLHQRKDCLDPSVLSSSILTRALHTDQTGSMFDYVKALAALSEQIPSVWTQDYHGVGKKSAHHRLCQFLRKGSLGAPVDFWTLLRLTLKEIPDGVLLNQDDPNSSKTEPETTISLDILDALHAGVRGESFASSDSGWQVYLELASRLCDLSQGESLATLLEQHIFPILASYVKPSINPTWAFSGPKAVQRCTYACHLMHRCNETFFEEKWQATSAQIMEDVDVSLPEQSKDYVKSQQTIIQETDRWYGLYFHLLDDPTSTDYNAFLSKRLRFEIESIITLLKNRHGKPYGAASALENAINASVFTLSGDTSLKEKLQNFANRDIPRLILSPSAQYLARCLENLQSTCDVKAGVEASLNNLEQAPQSLGRDDTIKYFLSSPGFVQADGLITGLADKVLQRHLTSPDGSSWDLIEVILANSAFPDKITDSVLSRLTDNLSIEADQDDALNSFENLSTKSSGRLHKFISSSQGAALLTNLLLLVESSDPEISSRAQRLSEILQKNQDIDGSSSQSSNTSVALIQSSFRHANPLSLSIESLARQSDLVFRQVSVAQKSAIAEDLLPNRNQWAAALEPHLARIPSPSLAVSSTFGSALSLVQTIPSRANYIVRDADGQSLALRMARYLLIMCENEDFAAAIAQTQKAIIVQKFALLLELASDDISARGSMPLLLPTKLGSDESVVDFVARGQHLLNLWAKGSLSHGMISNIQHELLQACVGRSCSSYYHARGYSNVAKAGTERRSQSHRVTDSQFKSALKDPEPFRAIANFSSDVSDPDALRNCNEALSNLTGRQLADDSDFNLFLLVLLNILLQNGSEILREIPQQRIVFFIKHVVDQLPTCSFPLQIELLKVIKVALSPITDIYGPFWGDLIIYLKKRLDIAIDEETLALLCASLQLCAHLQKLSMGDVNDDLLDAWAEQRDSIFAAVFNLLLRMKDLPDQSHQPRRIVNETLHRIIHRAKGDLNFDTQELYSGLASESVALQDATYDLLQEAIPRKQDDTSLEKGIDPSFVVTLPDELLSLIMAPPSWDDFAETDLAHSLPVSLRSYLLSWKLTLLHWDKASVAVQADYNKSLQEAGGIPGLLEFITETLITSRHKPIDASRFSIDSYKIDSGDPPGTDLDHLLIHLYYLVFLHLPSPAKTWWRDSTSRQTGIAVQAWTEKHISPLIATAELSAVKDWAATIATQSDSSDPALTVKVSQTTREITASIPIDDRNTAISIRLPPSYPLARAEVISVQRVGFAESKWQSWIINAQGQLTISDGGSNALIDCLLAWKRNVTAGMKGQTECAICYSVVGGDKTLPKKECPTCKNRFHAGCLFRWFKSSNSSSCPLCRNTFAYS